MFITTIKLDENNYYEAHRRVKGIFPNGGACFRYSNDTIKILSENKPENIRDAFLENKNIKKGKYFFKLQVHYVKRDKGTGKSVPASPYKFRDWLSRKLENSGASIITFDVLDDGFIFIDKQEGFHLYSVDINGEIEIFDIEKFEEFAVRGVGKKKSFGFGALVLE